MALSRRVQVYKRLKLEGLGRNSRRTRGGITPIESIIKDAGVCEVCKRCTEINALRITPALTTNCFFPFAFRRVDLSARFLSLPDATHLSYLQLITWRRLFPSFCFAVLFFSPPLFLSFPLSTLACLPPLHLFTNIGGRKEGSMQTFGPSYQPYMRPASSPQEAACSTHTHALRHTHTHTASKATHTPAVWPGN